MTHWKTEKYAEQVKKALPLRHVHCTYQDCPRFEGCTQVPSQSGPSIRKLGAKVFFVTDTTTEDEANLGVPSVQPAGKLLREAVVKTFTDLTMRQIPYLITKLFRANIGDRQPKAFEAKLCFSHFLKELKAYEPDIIAAFGAGCFQALYAQALNKNELPHKDDQTLSKLRGQTFTMVFEGDIKIPVYVGYPPGLVLQTPASYRFLLEDAVNLKRFFKPEKQSQVDFKVKEVIKLETPKDVFDYLDMLHRGLPKKTTVAFDTETDNLNRKFNNRFLTWQFSHEAGVGVSFPIDHKDKPLFADPELKKKLRDKMNGLFNAQPSETNVAWFTGHNIKFDFSVLWGLYGVIPRNPQITVPWWCTMLGMHWLDENRKALRGFLAGAPYSLKTLGREFFDFTFEEESLEKRGDGALEQLSLEQLYTYGASDAALTRAIMQHQVELAREQDLVLRRRLSRPEYKDTVQKLPKFQQRYYFPASRALAVMECNGLYVKEDHLSYLQGEDSPVWGRMRQIETDIQNLPDVLEFRKRYKDQIGGKVKNASDFERGLWDVDEDDLPLLNLNKKDQQTLFYLEYLKLTPLRMSRKTGQPQLNAKFLEHYSNPQRYKESETIQKVCSTFYSEPVGNDEKSGAPIFNDNPLKLELEYRKLKKLGTAYLDAIEGFLRNRKGDSLDGRVRASFNIHGTDTGRLSSQNPNMQQLPSGKISYAKEVKNMFQAEPPSEKFPDGTVLIQGDYKTAEVRWAALFSKDKNLIKVFSEAARIIDEAMINPNISDEEFKKAQEMADLHSRTASLMFGVPISEVSKPLRQSSKSITFGLLFGMTVKTLSENNGWTLEEGEAKLKKYFEAFPDLEKWLRKIPEDAKFRGFVETFMGRRRRLDHLFKIGEWKFQTDGERKAMNSSIQGQSSDAGTIGMFNFMQYIFDNNLEDRWLIQNIVHDSCLVQVPFYDVRKVLPIMKQCFVKGMQTYIETHWDVKLAIPIEMEFELGLKYGALKGWDGRQKTLDALLADLEKEKEKVWKKADGPRKPPVALDLVSYVG